MIFFISFVGRVVELERVVVDELGMVLCLMIVLVRSSVWLKLFGWLV